MTRTARASFPRAIVRDRSESKSGLDKSVRKNGGGPHNWGSLADEKDLEFAALDDEELELEEELGESTDNLSAQSDSSLEDKKPGVQRTTISRSNDELKTARKFRKHALKNGNLDLSDIARTSSAVAVPAKNTTVIASGAQTSVSV
ncbi:hypothetical protein DXG03_009349 [Asterophora parasitica]|uniref:Hyaluronan/mRNA-binding protein domain-containing protein n=1 Tax=Asterophora parasitica TaxID=117018 RepID=A0A9P7G4H3_9AGAR|nr:hypothetical protein DXG03_009349 [Asterophora parasitica]